MSKTAASTIVAGLAIAAAAAPELMAAAAGPELHPYVRVTAPSTEEAVFVGGQAWAGVSEVPKASLTAQQLAALKADPRLQVEEFERPHVVDDAPA